MPWRKPLIGKRILNVEDDPNTQEMMKDILEDLNCLVDLAKSGDEAVEKCKKQRYDLILMDILMPIKDGYQATKEIRIFEAEHHLPHVKIIAVTAKAFSEDREECLAAGMDDFISKPIDLGLLGSKMSLLLEG